MWDQSLSLRIPLDTESGHPFEGVIYPEIATKILAFVAPSAEVSLAGCGHESRNGLHPAEIIIDFWFGDLSSAVTGISNALKELSFPNGTSITLVKSGRPNVFEEQYVHNG